ncbi:MAG: hypothetical protein NTW51_00610 [Cyanobacteria bacterium]|nr:hypothetical protein [Cyanobacteriota bacterium]
MAEDTPRSIPSNRQEGQGRSPRQGDNREPGGFRIRLSDNEMQAARVLQEALGLRSTVAVLGFSLRTLAQQLEAGQLDELVAQQRAQAPDRGPAGAGRGERRGPRDEARGGGGGGGGGGNRPARANPFARPSKPVVSAPEPEPADAGEILNPLEGSPENSSEAVLDAPGFSVEESAEAALESDGSSAPADDGVAAVDASA